MDEFLDEICELLAIFFFHFREIERNRESEMDSERQEFWWEVSVSEV